MRVLVTGANGFVGQHLLRELVRDEGLEITGSTLDGSPGAGAFTHPRVRWLPLDVTSAESVRAAVEVGRPDQVYHLAGQSSVRRSFSAPLETWDINATGTLRLLEALSAQGLAATRVLVISSGEVYGALAEAEAQRPIPETAPVRPITPYGASKAAAEVVALQMAATGAVRVVVARSFNHIGPGQDERFALPSMARQLARIAQGEAEPVLRVGNLEARRDFLDVRDVVRAYLCLMERGANGQVYNVCSGEAHSLLEIVHRMIHLSATGARLEVDPERFRPADIPLLVGDGGRLRALGWTPRAELDETLTDLLRETEAL